MKAIFLAFLLTLCSCDIIIQNKINEPMTSRINKEHAHEKKFSQTQRNTVEVKQELYESK